MPASDWQGLGDRSPEWWLRREERLQDRLDLRDERRENRQKPETIADVISWVQGDPSIERRSSSRIVGATPGVADLTGVSELINNLSFRRLWENVSKTVDDQKYLNQFSQPSSITQEQGPGNGFMWGYLDPSWLPGFNPGKKITTIEEIITPMLRKLVTPGVPATTAPPASFPEVPPGSNERPRVPRIPLPR